MFGIDRIVEIVPSVLALIEQLDLDRYGFEEPHGVGYLLQLIL